MTLPSSPPIALAQVRAECSAPAGTPLHAFVRGSQWFNDVSKNNGVPTSPPVRLADLCGAEHNAAPDYTPVSASVSPSSITRTAQGLSSSGRVNGGVTATGHGGNGSYTYAWDVVSGDFNFGATGDDAAGTLSSNYLIADGQTITGSVRCLVSDGTSSDYTPTVPVSLSYEQIQ